MILLLLMMAAVSAPRRWATTVEAAEYSRLDRHTLRQWAAEGRLTLYRFGTRNVRYDLDEIDALMEPVPTVAAVRRARASR